MPVIDEREEYLLGFEDSDGDKCKDCRWTEYDEMNHIYCQKLYFRHEEHGKDYLGGTSLYGRCEHFENKNENHEIKYIFTQDTDW